MARHWDGLGRRSDDNVVSGTELGGCELGMGTCDEEAGKEVVVVMKCL